MSKLRAVGLCVVLVGCQEYDLQGNDAEPTEEEERVAGPAIEVTPRTLDFGQVGPSERPELPFTIRNVGEADLDLGDVTSDHAAFAIDSEVFRVLQPGEEVVATVTYAPQSELDAGLALVHSSDPEQPVVEVDLYGGADAVKPVAVCGVNPGQVQALYETATWTGAGSYDPAGGPLTYDWALVSVPPGSNPTLPSAAPTDPDRPGFLPDVVGVYTAELVVTSEQGVASDPCTAELEAIPATDLWVEMFWQTAGDDMDLHVVRAGGSLRTAQDCYYSNCRSGLEWGPSGPEADPLLDIDDIGGTGPENINIDLPEDVVYQIWVNDFPSSAHQQANDVTVNIYLSGTLAWTDTRALSGEDVDEHFADVDWATQQVIPR